MEIDGVFSGGGVKAFAFIGALQALEEKEITFHRIAGTSAGAIFATLIAAGFRSDELKELFLNVRLESFLDQSKISKYLPFIKWLTLYKTMGLYRGKTFEDWIAQQLASKGVIRFSDISKDRLKIIAADLTLSRVVVFPDDLKRFYHIDPQYYSVAKAVRSSVSIPYFFRPTKIIHPLTSQKSILVDGMISSNFPLWLFDRDEQIQKRPIIGMQLTNPRQYYFNKKIDNAIDLLSAMIGTMRKASDARYISENIANHILFFPIEEVDATSFDLSREEKERLIQFGYQRTSRFLEHWP